MLFKSSQRDRFLIFLAITFLTVHNHPHPNFSTENFLSIIFQRNLVDRIDSRQA